jgi:hypothetical protein
MLEELDWFLEGKSHSPPPKRPPSERVKEVMSTYSEAEAAKRLEAEALELAELEAQRRKRAR